MVETTESLTWFRGIDPGTLVGLFGTSIVGTTHTDTTAGQRRGKGCRSSCSSSEGRWRRWRCKRTNTSNRRGQRRWRWGHQLLLLLLLLGQQLVRDGDRGQRDGARRGYIRWCVGAGQVVAGAVEIGVMQRGGERVVRHHGGHRAGADGTGSLDGGAGQLEGTGCLGC